MITHKKTFFLGIFIFLTPFLGVPSSWKTFLVVASGVLLVFWSIKIGGIPKKPVKTVRTRREKPAPVLNENLNPTTLNKEIRTKISDIQIK